MGGNFISLPCGPIHKAAHNKACFPQSKWSKRQRLTDRQRDEPGPVWKSQLLEPNLRSAISTYVLYLIAHKQNTLAHTEGFAWWQGYQEIGIVRGGCLGGWLSQKATSNICQMLTPSFYFLACHVSCGILVPLLRIEPGPSAMSAQRPNHWTTREFLTP